MNWIEDLKVGDKVHVRLGQPTERTRIETVERLTKTRVITNKASYAKSTGKEIGYSDSWWPQTLWEKVEGGE